MFPGTINSIVKVRAVITAEEFVEKKCLSPDIITIQRKIRGEIAIVITKFLGINMVQPFKFDVRSNTCSADIKPIDWKTDTYVRNNA
jgi:hypothetical protein